MEAWTYTVIKYKCFKHDSGAAHMPEFSFSFLCFVKGDFHVGKKIKLQQYIFIYRERSTYNNNNNNNNSSSSNNNIDFLIQFRGCDKKYYTVNEKAGYKQKMKETRK